MIDLFSAFTEGWEEAGDHLSESLHFLLRSNYALRNLRPARRLRV